MVYLLYSWGFPSGNKKSSCNVRATGDVDSIPELEDPLEKRMATPSSILAWRIPWTEEPGGYSPQDPKELHTTEAN